MVLEMENVNEVQRRWRNEFGTPPPPCVIIARLRDKFETDVTVQNVNKGRSEDLAFQLTLEVLRQCYGPTENIREVCKAMLS
jgi:hypothetical protein